MIEHHPKHGYLPWAADRAQRVGLFHVAALIRSAMTRIEALEHDIDRHIAIASEQANEIERLREALEQILNCDPITYGPAVIARAALKETE